MVMIQNSASPCQVDVVLRAFGPRQASHGLQVSSKSIIFGMLLRYVLQAPKLSLSNSLCITGQLGLRQGFPQCRHIVLVLIVLLFVKFGSVAVRFFGGVRSCGVVARPSLQLTHLL